MREILFRGKRTDNGEWLEGYYYKAKYCRTDDKLCDYITIPYIEQCNLPNSHYIVNPETVGQCIGLKDRNGINIALRLLPFHHCHQICKRPYI